MPLRDAISNFCRGRKAGMQGRGEGHRRPTDLRPRGGCRMDKNGLKGTPPDEKRPIGALFVQPGAAVGETGLEGAAVGERPP